MNYYSLILLGQLNFFYEVFIPMFILMRRQEKRRFIWLRLAVLAALGAAGIGLLAAGVACAAAGLLMTVYSFVLMAMEGFAGGLLAQAGIGLGLAAVGLLLLPAFWAAAKGLFLLCKKVIAATAKLIGGKKEA